MNGNGMMPLVFKYYIKHQMLLKVCCCEFKNTFCSLTLIQLSGEMTCWNDIMKNIDFCKTIEGFHYLDGVVYTQKGLIHRHLVSASADFTSQSLSQKHTKQKTVSGNGSTSSRASYSRPNERRTTPTSTSCRRRGSTSALKVSASTVRRTVTSTSRSAMAAVVCSVSVNIRVPNRPFTSLKRRRDSCERCCSRPTFIWRRVASVRCIVFGWAMVSVVIRLSMLCCS
jgi:hypothetical protein